MDSWYEHGCATLQDPSKRLILCCVNPPQRPEGARGQGIKQPRKSVFEELCILFISFQYLEIRYNSRLVRTLASLSYVVASVASTGIVLYAPCLSLRTVTGLPLVGLVLMGGLIATFYTVLVSRLVFLIKNGPFGRVHLRSKFKVAT